MRAPAIRLVLIVASAALLVAACGKGGAPQGGFPPSVVAVQEVKARPIPVEFEFPAQTAGSREVEVRARVTGILEKRNYEEGAKVRAGQSLFTLDAAPFQAALARTQADLASAEATAAQAKRTAARYKPLWDAKAISQKEYDDAVSADEVANAAVNAARTRVTEAKLNLGYTRVESPAAGISSRALKSEGSLVSGPDVLLTTVSQVDPIYVNFGVSEGEQSRLKADIAAGKLKMPKDGQFEVIVRLEDGTLVARPGKLAFTDVRLSTATGTSDSRAELPNPDASLRPGQFVRVILRGAVRPDALAIPQRAVMEGPTGKMVYLLGPDSKAVPVPVVVGEWSGSDWIITSGVKPGDKVIVEGLMKVYPGAQVVVGDPNAPPPGAAGKGPSPKGEGAAKPPNEKK
jgi:membrane fusion protein, multidrug efflux system